MAKVKKSKRRKSTAGKVSPTAAAPETASFSPYKSAFYALLLGIAMTGGWYFWQAQAGEEKFVELAASYTGSREQVRSMKNLGGGHLTPGQSIRYSDTFPTSGIHADGWTDAGIYTNPQPDTLLVHALEHGNIVIYYDQPAGRCFRHAGVVVKPVRQHVGGDRHDAALWPGAGSGIDRLEQDAAAEDVPCGRGSVFHRHLSGPWP